ncbi:hypothetical protein B0H13DRAFT_1917076 [Mycena leptocephala]|nr:hypothetical protein B0H13DRAFT_1917076 [Mycena leptocephala]
MLDLTTRGMFKVWIFPGMMCQMGTMKVHGYIVGATPEMDTYLFPTSAMMEEFSDHYYMSGTFLRQNLQAHQRDFIEEGVARMKGALQYSSWNKRRIRDIARDIPAQFLYDF